MINQNIMQNIISLYYSLSNIIDCLLLILNVIFKDIMDSMKKP